LDEDAAATVRQLNLMLYWSPEVSTEAALSAESSTVVWTARALHVLLTLDAVAMMWLLVPATARIKAPTTFDASEIAS
jgi:hypothetical protein